MSWEYTKDNRTDQQVKAHYDMGKRIENLVIEKLKEYGVLRRSLGNDKFGYLDSYTPDCEVIIKGEVIPLEIKYTKVDLKVVHWKTNQWLEAVDLNGKLLQISWRKCCLIDPFDKHLILEPEESYCNKPVKCFYEINWEYNLKKLFND